MDPPPRPSTGRFRIRVAVFAPEDAHNLQATPQHTFVIAKSQDFPLEDLPLKELRDVAIRRYKDIYPHESLFQITRSTDAYGSDLFLNDRVGDIFADNEVLRVTKGASIRDSLPPDYVQGRTGSVQPSFKLQRKRSPASSNLGDISRAGKRQKVYRPDDPLPSRERDSSVSDEENAPQDLPTESIIPNSQGDEAENVNGHLKEENEPQLGGLGFNEPSPILGRADDAQPVASDSRGKEAQALERTVNPTTQTRQTRQSLRNSIKTPEGLRSTAKITPKTSDGAAIHPPSKKRDRSDDIPDVEGHISATPARRNPDPYSDIETDDEHSSSILQRRGHVTPLRHSGKPSPIGTRSRLLQYGKSGSRITAGSGSTNSTPNKLLKPASTTIPHSTGLTNDDLVQSAKSNRNVSASTDSSVKSDESLDAGAEQAAKELSRLTSKAMDKKRNADLERESRHPIGSTKEAPEEAAKQKQAQEEREEAERRSAANAIATAKIKFAAKQRLAESARKQEERRLAAEGKGQEESPSQAKAAEAKAKVAKENALAEEARRQKEETIAKAEAEKLQEAKKQEAEATVMAEAAKREEAKRQEAEATARAEAATREEESVKRKQDIKDNENSEISSARKRSTSARSPGGMLGKAVAAFNSETATAGAGAKGADMPPPATTALSRLSTSPVLARKLSEENRTTRPILPRRGSSDVRSASSVEPGSTARRVSFAETSPSIAGKTPSKATQSPPPTQTPRTVNGIQSSSSRKRQTKIVPPGVGAISVKGRVDTPSSSQLPSSSQQIKSTPTPQPRGNISAALLNTISKRSSSAVKETPKPSAITISSDEESDDESVGELELPPLLPPSTAQSQRLPPSGVVAAGGTTSNHSRSASASTNRSQRESRSPVRFVNSSFHSHAASSTQSLAGSRPQQSRSNGSETSERSSSDDSGSDDEASEPELSSIKPKPSAAIPSSQSTASRRILPSPSRLSLLREGSATPKPQNGGLRKASSGSDGDMATQKQLDNQLTGETVSSSMPTKSQASPAPSLSQSRSGLSSTPVSRRSPRVSERPALMGNRPSLQRQTSEALKQNEHRLAQIRKKGEAAAKALNSMAGVRLPDAQSEEESEPESSSSNDTNSDSENESGSEGDKSDDVVMGGMGAGNPVKAKAQKSDLSFSSLSKRFSLPSVSRR